MRRIGDHRARHAARPLGVQSARLAAERNPPGDRPAPVVADDGELADPQRIGERENVGDQLVRGIVGGVPRLRRAAIAALVGRDAAEAVRKMRQLVPPGRSEEHTSELKSLMRISYAVFCWKKKIT